VKQKVTTPRISVDSTGRVYQQQGGQWNRMRGVRADALVNAQRHYLKRSVEIVRLQRYIIWTFVALAVVLLYLRGCR
jgi:hypothetical protein